MVKITIEETLRASDVIAAGFAPFLIYSEVIEGARRPLSFLQVIQEDFSLIGATGRTIKFMYLTQLQASAAGENAIVGGWHATYLSRTGGMAAADKEVNEAEIEVADVIYSAVELSDYLTEDYPNIDWVRKHLRNMGKAVLEYLDLLVYQTLNACACTACVCFTATANWYQDITNALATMENNFWVAGDGMASPFLLTSPMKAAAMIQDTQFIETRRYTTDDVAKIVQGELGLYGGTRVLKSPLLAGEDCSFIVFPPNSGYGPVIMLVWKRRLTVKNEYSARHAYTYYVTNVRANCIIVQPLGVCKICTEASP